MILITALLLIAAQPAPGLPPPPPPPTPSNTGAEAVVAPDRGGVDDALGRAATRPLRDMNIVKPKVAP